MGVATEVYLWLEPRKVAGRYGAMRGKAPQIAGQCPATHTFCGAPAKNILKYIKSRKSVFCGQKTRFYVQCGAIHVNI